MEMHFGGLAHVISDMQLQGVLSQVCRCTSRPSSNELRCNGKPSLNLFGVALGGHNSGRLVQHLKGGDCARLVQHLEGGDWMRAGC